LEVIGADGGRLIVTPVAIDDSTAVEPRR